MIETTSLPYSVLMRLPPETYLHAECFWTPYDDADPARARAQYEKGLRIGSEYDAICITWRATWYATRPDRGTMQSAEGIGYHGNTKELLQGFLDSGARVIVSRWPDGSELTNTIIKESTK